MKTCLLLLLIVLSAAARAETIPALHAGSLADVQVNLPADLHDKIGILVIGFSKKSSLQTKQWNQSLLPDYGNDPRIVYYEGAVLADAPALFRGMIISSIRNHMSDAERAHFIPILQDAVKWKDAAHFTSADEAYILLIDGAGEIKWRAHGERTEEAYRQMKASLAALQGGR
jgi:hypothetical protein